MIKHTHDQNEKILLEDTPSESIYIVKDGILEYTTPNSNQKQIKAKEFFGELDLIFNVKTKAEVKVCSETAIVFQLPKSLLIETMGENFKDFLVKEIVRQAFAESMLFKNSIIEDYFLDIYASFKVIIFGMNEVVIKKNTDYRNNIFIVASGSLVNVSVMHFYVLCYQLLIIPYIIYIYILLE